MRREIDLAEAAFAYQSSQLVVADIFQIFVSEFTSHRLGQSMRVQLHIV